MLNWMGKSDRKGNAEPVNPWKRRWLKWRLHSQHSTQQERSDADTDILYYFKEL